MSDLNDLNKPTPTDTELDVLDTLRAHIARAAKWSGWTATANKVAGLMSATTAAVTGGRSMRLYRRNDLNTADEEIIQLPGMSIGGSSALATNADGLRRAGDIDGSGSFVVRLRPAFDNTYYYLRAYDASNAVVGDVRVGYANSAGGVAWGNVSGKPTNFVFNDGGSYSISISGNAATANAAPLLGLTGVVRFFVKTDTSIVLFTKTSVSTLVTSQSFFVAVNGAIKSIAAGTSVTMPTLAAGTNYAVWANANGTLQASSSFVTAPTAGAEKIGGFHFAPGGNASARTGGDTTPQINEFSIWDLKFKPNCPDPRGMTLVAGSFWTDIYLTGVDAITNGSSAFDVVIADGSTPPKVPAMFGGNGTTTYESYTWFEAMELATAFGKRCPTQREFMALAYGTTEASSVDTDQFRTILNSAYTSKWGVVQATGFMWIWGDERGGPYGGNAWSASTEGRGSQYNAPNAVLFGGLLGSGLLCGSRCSTWALAASQSDGFFGSRFCCDHLQLE